MMNPKQESQQELIEGVEPQQQSLRQIMQQNIETAFDQFQKPTSCTDSEIIFLSECGGYKLTVYVDHAEHTCGGVLVSENSRRVMIIPKLDITTFQIMLATVNNVNFKPEQPISKYPLYNLLTEPLDISFNFGNEE